MKLRQRKNGRQVEQRRHSNVEYNILKCHEVKIFRLKFLIAGADCIGFGDVPGGRFAPAEKNLKKFPLGI